MGTDYRRNLPNNAYQAATTANGPSQQNPYATVADLGTGSGGDTLLISGGASYSGTGLDFDVSILVFKIAGVQYTTPAETTVTLAAGDPTFARFDAIIATLDASDNPIVDVIQGTPSATPVTPALSADQVLVQYVDIQAGATTPNITTVQVYREDQTSDWLGSVSGGLGNAAVFSSTTPAPTEGSFCCLNTIGRYGIRRGTRFEAPVAVDRAQYLLLTFKIYLVDDFVANHVLYVRIFGYSALPTDEGGTGAYIGFIDIIPYMDLTAVGQWQLVTIPTGLFQQNLSVDKIGFLNFTVYNCPPALDKCGGTALKDNSGNLITLQYAIDDVKLQTGFIPSPQTPTIDVLENTLPVGPTRALDFQDGNNTTVDVTESLVNDTIEVKYNVASSYFGTVNGRTIVEVTSASDLPATLVANTTYLIRGTVSTSTSHTCNVDGVEILGLDRTVDILEYTGSSKLFSITDCDFTVRQVGFRDTGSAIGIIEGTNYTAGVPANNYGRTKVVQVFGCEFRGCNGLIFLKGYELVDINNTLIWYHTGPKGLIFNDVRHLEISSCELYNWFDEATGTIYSTADMITLGQNGVDNQGFAVVNINSSIIHPEETQVGLNIDSSSTTRFGTIASNTFIDVGITTGGLFLPINAFLLPDYSQTSTTNFDIFANQGLLNSTSGTVMTLTGNTTNTALSAGVPAIINTNGGVVQQAGVRYTVTGAGRATYTGSKQVYVSIHASISYEKQGGGVDDYKFYIYKNGSLLPGAEVDILVSDEASTALPMIYGTLMTQNDYIEFYVENPTGGDDMLVRDFQVVIRE